VAGEPAPSTPAVDEEIEVRLERFLFRNEGPDGSFGVALVAPPGQRTFTAVGPIPAVPSGEILRLIGRWAEHPKFGRQFTVSIAFPVLPATAAGIERFLASGLVKGVGPKLAKRVVARFGEQTLQVLEHEPRLVAEVPGIGPKRAAAIRHSLVEQRHVSELLVFLRGYDIPTGVVLRIHRAWGEHAVPRLRENPWRLASEISGIGFRTTDSIAQRLGLPQDSIHRAAAALLHALGEAASSGHCLVERDELIRTAEVLLAPIEPPPEPKPPPVEPALEELVTSRRVVVEDSAVYQPRLHRAEVDLARRLRDLAARPRTLPPTRFDQDLADFERDEGLTLAPPQREAVRSALCDRLVVVTGGPGTGKTTLVRAIVKLARREHRQIALAAPTGRAAKRLAEASGTEAKTLHRLLEVEPTSGAFQRHEGNPIDAELILVDEASMLDLLLAASLLAAVPSAGRLVLVGDIDQLPSVGPGQVLGDLIASGLATVVRLERIFRQGGGSRIVDSAHRVLAGLMPVPAESLDDPGADYFFIPREDPEEARATIETLVAERIPKRFGLDPWSEIQVLAPMHRSELGTTRLNETLQQRLNPNGERIPASRGLRIGDRVLQTRNNYELGVFNGDLGRILSVDPEEGTIVVDFEGRQVEVNPPDHEDLTLAYACSVHKAQGSEYPAVVVPIHTQHYPLLQRNLLYTAITRGRRLVVVVGNRRAVALAVRNVKASRRMGRLLERLRPLRC
jgi:exodeoxyribonuclease V alpha subunit